MLRVNRPTCQRPFLLALLTFCLLSGAALAAPTIIIDAGHGGHDRGGVPGQRIAEKTMTLDVARRVRSRLAAAGYRTVMTRNSDDFVSLGGRVAFCRRYKSAVFVSIHFNSASRVGARGFETFYYSSRSRSLADRMHRSLRGAFRTEDRGVKRRGFYVLRNNPCPAVLVECGFLTNPAEAAIINQSAYRQRIADRIADGIKSAY